MIQKWFLLFNLLIHGCWATAKPPSNKILSIKTICSRDLIHVKLEMGRFFRGIVFAKDFQDECKTRGKMKSIHILFTYKSYNKYYGHLCQYASIEKVFRVLTTE